MARKWRYIYAVVRYDHPYEGFDTSVLTDSFDRARCSEFIESHFRVKNVFASEESAEHEAVRLNELNGDKECLYLVQRTQMMDVA